MNLLLIGSGGREHAIAWKLAQSPKVNKIYVAPGNGGTAVENKCENVNIADIKELAAFAKEKDIYLTVVGPEVPLVDGIVDEFKAEGLRIFGPDKRGAALEGSKSFSKAFMKKYGVKTAEYGEFTDAAEAKKYLDTCEYPIVIKADGLAAGKGVEICETKEDAYKAIDSFMLDDVFDGAGLKVVIEEFLEGVEASILSICDGKTIIPFKSAKDHKQIYDGGKGPNTGGMGAICPNPFVDEAVLKDFEENISKNTLKGIQEEGFEYKGIIFFGLMITKKGTYLLEYNVRMGDPETQSVLSMMDSDLFELIEAAMDEKLNEFEVKWKEGVCINVVLASKGYPRSYNKGYEITIDDSIRNEVFMAGVKADDGKLLTNGGRVLSVIGQGKTVMEAREKAYENVKKVNFKDSYNRTDIGIFK
ncbi:MAG: phosphoribosylamine--glycine ligase [Clostridium sp.]|uniref:phosphoribosylamine--glycine ligase n=1 Tax=Clostridium sp. DSM 8431 TaxID=1761781 RepID=UPI0008F1822F|nr:phosphoribosylamine--glycine ligase [Clostridium sp. DSM 8431]MCR4943002.1 phosphoribosylamine--glycine ligase [Clostridium sp.]SFU61949.1 phosphoribosylamine--glycine ligase [Clostridium sp. DSM 8431]